MWTIRLHDYPESRWITVVHFLNRRLLLNEGKSLAKFESLSTGESSPVLPSRKCNLIFVRAQRERRQGQAERKKRERVATPIFPYPCVVCDEIERKIWPKTDYAGSWRPYKKFEIYASSVLNTDEAGPRTAEGHR